MQNFSRSRRHFVQRAGALAALGLGSGTSLIANAQGAGGYKALVCVFLYGGNDGNNTVVPFDAAGYAQYAAVRTAASGIQLAQSALLPIQPASLATPFALHPSLVEMQGLFGARRLAVLANVGTLVQPTSKSQYIAGQVPLSLYSHSDQQAQWQSSVSNVATGTGWGGRIADKLAPLATKTMPLAEPPPKNAGRFGEPLELRRVHWVKPSLVAAVEYLTWTDGGTLRAVTYQGLREDKPARAVVREPPG